MKQLFILALLMTSCATATQPRTPLPIIEHAPPAKYADIPRWEKGSSIQPPKAIHRVEPLLPTALRHSVRNGRVTIELVIDENGNAVDGWYVDGDPRLAKPFIDASREWRYKPATLDGKPVTVRVQETMTVSTSTFAMPSPR